MPSLVGLSKAGLRAIMKEEYRETYKQYINAEKINIK
jgi:hypothetical protein